jgi:transmembrane sensor
VANVSNDIDDLIGKYLAQEASAEERVVVENWLIENEDNLRYFNHLKSIFERAATVKNLQHFDTDLAWRKLRSKIQDRQGNNIRTLTPDAFGLFWRIAASAIIIAGIGYFTYLTLQPAQLQPLELISKTQIKSDTLPDGSNVFLNKQTQLAYSFDKKKKIHQVKLKGEAYFAIQHQEEKTFVIEVEGVFIRDIGTAFNVKAYPDSTTIEVVVEEGEVMFYTANNEGISLTAGEKGVYNKTTRIFEEVKPEPNITSYKSKQFVFNNATLGAIVQQLNSIYEKQIVIEDHLKNCPLTVSFNNENIDEIASVISETLALTVKNSDKGIVLEGKGCNE